MKIKSYIRKNRPKFPRMNRFLLFLFIFSTTCKAQTTLGRSTEHLLFKEAKSGQAILILKDSLLYKGNPLKQRQFSHTPYPSVLKDYLPFSIHNKTYLVYRGCGTVLEWRNDTIVRVDNSFLHRNQFFASTFTYNNKIYFFGGYGLFTYKNIVTKYNPTTKEWDEEETFGNPPSPRRLALSHIINNDLYLFSGYEKDEDNFSQNKEVAPIVWKLNLPTMTWSQAGKYSSNLNINSKDGIASSFTINEKLYIIPLTEYSYVYEIDLKNNTIITFKGKAKSVEQTFYDNKTNEVVYIYKDGDGVKSLVRTKLQEFLGKQVSREAFILPWYLSLSISVIIIVITGLFLLLILLLYINKRRSRFVPFSGITFHSKSTNFYFRGKLLDTLDDAEILILDYLVQNRHRFVSLNELNHLYENEINKNNFSTVVKRREVAFASLLSKLQILTSKIENDILISRKNKEDKRIKEIKLKENFIRIK